MGNKDTREVVYVNIDDQTVTAEYEKAPNGEEYVIVSKDAMDQVLFAAGFREV